MGRQVSWPLESFVHSALLPSGRLMNIGAVESDPVC